MSDCGERSAITHLRPLSTFSPGWQQDEPHLTIMDEAIPNTLHDYPYLTSSNASSI